MVPTNPKVERCEQVVLCTGCGKNAKCVSTSTTTAYCACQPGYYGNPLVECTAAIGEKYIIAQQLRLNMSFNKELETQTTDTFRRYKAAFENVLEKAYVQIFEKDYETGSVQITKFRYSLILLRK